MKSATDAYDTQYDSSDNLKKRMRLFESDSKESIWSALWRTYSFSKNARVLEVGGGNGEFWVDNASNISPTNEVVFTDFSEGMVLEAKERLPLSNFSFQVADAANLDFKDASFDWVLAHFMLYHLKDPEKAISEAARVLRPDGAYGIVVFERPKEAISTQLEIAYSLLPEIEPVFNETSRLHFFADDAQKLLGNYFKATTQELSAEPNNQHDAKVVADALLSLPAFQTDIVPDGFYEEFINKLREHIAKKGPIDCSQPTARIIARSPIG